MNRKILFRGKRVDNGEWIEGSLLSFESGAPAIAQSKSIALFPKEKSMISIANCFEVIPETVGQYTEIKDKNGKRIFEGDIVDVSGYDYVEPSFSCCGEVVMGGLIGVGIMEGPSKCIPLYELQGEYCTEIEVMGNIYDNPEWAEGAKHD